MIRPITMLRFVCLSLVISLSAACAQDRALDTPPPPDADPTLVDEGWNVFESGDYDAAASAFIQAITEDASNSEAHNGLGWALLSLGNLKNSLLSFDAALANSFTGADPHVGKTVILRDHRPPVDYAAAIAEANMALAIDGDYAFAHDPKLDWKDVRLILAQSYFATGAYIEANNQVELLGGNVQDPASPTFVLDLLAEIQALGESIGG